jgi:hypothetical protein
MLAFIGAFTVAVVFLLGLAAAAQLLTTAANTPKKGNRHVR